MNTREMGDYIFAQIHMICMENEYLKSVMIADCSCILKSKYCKCRQDVVRVKKWLICEHKLVTSLQICICMRISKSDHLHMSVMTC